MQALARFGADRLGPPDEAAPRPQMTVFGLLAPFHRPEPDGTRFHTRLEVDGETFDLVADGQRLSTRRQPAGVPDLTVRASARDVVAARQGTRPLADGGSAAFARFGRLFQLA